MKFICSATYGSFTPEEVFIHEAESAEQAAIAEHKRRAKYVLEDHASRVAKWEERVAEAEARGSAKKPRRPAELKSQLKPKPVVVFDPNSGEWTLWKCTPPAPPPVEQWNWNSEPYAADLDEDELEMDDEEDEF